MQVTASLDLNLDALLKKKGINDMGRVQKFIDNECIRLMYDYTPNRNGMLIASLKANTVIGEGMLKQHTPYARYLYYGKLYVDPITLKGAFYSDKYGFWSRPGVSKIPDPGGRMLKYDQNKSIKAGRLWFERMKADHLENIRKGAAKVAEQ